MSAMPTPAGPSRLTAPNADGIALHGRAQDMPALPVGVFTRCADGSLLAIAGTPGQVHVSIDQGRSWETRPLSVTDGGPVPGPTGALLCSRSGALILGFADLARKKWTWDNALRDAPGACLPTCVTRSLDNGRTWESGQTLHEDWTGATRDIVQTRTGRVLFCSMMMRHNPGRHTVLTYGSDDDGVTWEPSNVIDLGGNGHHGGVTEGTVVELGDGSLYQLIRTNWGQLWRALSTDEGRTWHPYGPAGIPASSTPAKLTRLASGRVMLLWNQPVPEGADTYPLWGGDGIWSSTPASNFRGELSMSFSEDECQTWSPPVVVARRADGEVCYPHAFEPEPGVLWITAHRFDLRLALREEDFVS